ncbi:MAG: hypothetical protein HY813_01325 [Candidatus Portnoybacteria bacterium]|nr:hypothetical protein [Candidatus Portnoybacteria bacterium]
MNTGKKRERRKKFFNREKILDKLLSVGEATAEGLLGLTLEMVDIAEAMTLSPQSAQRVLRNRKYRHINIDLKSEVAFWSLLSKLKKENLITKNQGDRIVITKEGEKYLQSKIERPSRYKRYSTENLPEAEIVLVVFDVPEEKRAKRDWLRFQLAEFSFKALQKSVWWGETGLPKEFIKDLKKYEIFPYVHIFSVKKKGTISSIVSE